MMKTRFAMLVLLAILCLAAGVFGSRLSFEEHAAVQESLARVHPRMRARWLRDRGLDDSYYTTFHRPESTGLKSIGRWPWGPSWELAGRDTFLYLGSGSGVRILSIADSVQPRMLGQINARGLVSQVVVQDSLLFVACGSWGAQIYSVAHPANPRELGSIDEVVSTACVQDTICFTLGNDSMTVYNVARPGEPARLAAVGDAGGILAIQNGYVFSAGSSGLNVYDVRVPTVPTWVGSRGGSYLGLFVRGTLLFCTGIQPSYFTILDVSNPASMVQLGTINGYGGEDICVVGNLACLSCVYDHDGLYTIDVSDSTHPAILGDYVPDGAEFFDVYIRPDGLRSYMASWYGGLSVGDISNPGAPHEVWFGCQADQAVDIAVDGSRAYVADLNGGMRILDISNPAAPAELGLYDIPGNKEVRTATTKDSFAFACRAGSAGRKYLHVLDVLDPSNPTLVAQESCFNPPEDYVLRDSFIYAAEANKFQVFNVARPREPVRLGSCAGDGVAIVVQDSFAFTAAGAIRVTNVARPDSPFVVSTIYGHSATGLAVQDTFLYIPYVYDTLFTYSVATPSQPRLLSAVQTGVWPWDLVLGESMAYVALSDGVGVEVFDMANPGLPVRRGLCSAPGDIRRLDYDEGLVYAAMWEAGVAIYETTTVGIKEQASVAKRPRGLRVWPSVTGGDVRFTVAPSVGGADIAVYDVLGKRLGGVRLKSEQKGDARQGSADLAGLPAGVYVIRVKSEGVNLKAKVVRTDRR